MNANIDMRAPSISREFSFSLLKSGIPQGGIVEVSGTLGGGKTEVVLRFLAEHPSVAVAWIEEQFTVYPCAFLRNQVDLKRVLFIEAQPADSSWVLRQVLKSQLFKVVVFSPSQSWGRSWGETALRRFQLWSESAGAALILLMERLSSEWNSWPIAMQVEARRARGDENIILNLFKYRKRGFYGKSA